MLYTECNNKNNPLEKKVIYFSQGSTLNDISTLNEKKSFTDTCFTLSLMQV